MMSEEKGPPCKTAHFPVCKTLGKWQFYVRL